MHKCHYRFLWRTREKEVRWICRVCGALMVRGKIYEPL
jgi:hypothetical protein